MKTKLFAKIIAICLILTTIIPAFAAENDLIQNGFSSQDEQMFRSFASAYNWDMDKKWTKNWENNGKEYVRLHEYQDSLLKGSYQSMVDYTLADDEVITDPDTNVSVTTLTGTRKDTMAFLEEHKIKLGSAYTSNGSAAGGVWAGGSTFGGNNIIAVARSQIGTTDSSIYNSYANPGSLDAAWCAAFVSWCANQCGYVDEYISCNVGCGYMIRDLCDNRGYSYYQLCDTVVNGVQNGYVPVAGDIIMYCSAYSFGSTLHVGFVDHTDLSGKTLVTVEGNTTAGHNTYGVWERTMSFSSYQSCMANGDSFFGHVYIIHVPWPNQEANDEEKMNQFRTIYDLLGSSKYNLSDAVRKKVSAALLANINAISGSMANYNGTDARGKERFGLAAWSKNDVASMKEWYKNENPGFSGDINTKIDKILGKDGSSGNAKTQIEFLLYDLSTNHKDIWNFMTTANNSREQITTKSLQYFFPDEGLTAEIQDRIQKESKVYHNISVT